MTTTPSPRHSLLPTPLPSIAPTTHTEVARVKTHAIGGHDADVNDGVERGDRRHAMGGPDLLGAADQPRRVLQNACVGDRTVGIPHRVGAGEPLLVGGAPPGLARNRLPLPQTPLLGLAVQPRVRRPFLLRPRLARRRVSE